MPAGIGGTTNPWKATDSTAGTWARRERSNLWPSLANGHTPPDYRPGRAGFLLAELASLQGPPLQFQMFLAKVNQHPVTSNVQHGLSFQYSLARGSDSPHCTPLFSSGNTGINSDGGGFSFDGGLVSLFNSACAAASFSIAP